MNVMRVTGMLVVLLDDDDDDDDDDDGDGDGDGDW